MSVDKWMTKLTREFGLVAEKAKAPNESVIKMPSPSLNWAIGNGGITKGKAICLFGPESGGKSLLMQLILIQLQRDNPDGIVVLFDTEYSFNKLWFAQLGGDLKRLYLRQSNDPVKIFDYIYGEMLELIQDGCPIIGMAIDSVKNIKYPKDVKKNSTDATMGGGGASYLGSTLKSVLPVIREHEITTILVQQVYEEMDQYKAGRNPWKIPDGRALKHFCDYMLQVEKGESKATILSGGKDMRGGDQQIGHKVIVKSKKNRVGAPYRTAEFMLKYDEGIINQSEEICDLAISLHVVFHPISESSGKPNPMMWAFGNHPPIRGEANFRKWVAENPAVQDEIIIACTSVKDSKVLDSRNSAFSSDTDIDINNLDDEETSLMGLNLNV